MTKFLTFILIALFMLPSISQAEWPNFGLEQRDNKAPKQVVKNEDDHDQSDGDHSDHSHDEDESDDD